MRITPLHITLSVFLVACQAGPTQTDEPSESFVTIGWVVTQLEDAEFDEPRNTLSFVVTGAVEQNVDLGEFSGSFVDGRELSITPEPDVLLKGIFWWAGGGDEIIVKQLTPDTLTVLHRPVDEQVEPGAYEPKAEITIPAGTRVELAPWTAQ